VNDDTKTAMDLTDAISTHGGWVGASVAGAAAWVMKLSAGRTLKTLDTMASKLTEIDARLSRIEGRFDEKDHS